MVGGESRDLGMRASEFDPTRVEITFGGQSGVAAIGNSISGGKLGGLIEFRKQVLDPARKSLGETAQALALTFNEQHASGMDLYGNLGGEFFAIDPPAVSASRNNAGTGTATATIADLGALSGAEYVLTYDGAAYNLTRADTARRLR